MNPHAWSARISAALVLSAVAYAVFADPGATLTFSPEDLSFGKLDGFDTVTLRGADLRFRTGEPVLPVRYVRLALPIGTEAVSVECRTSAPVAVPGTYRITPGTKPVPLSHPAVPKRVPGPVYRSAEPYPAVTAELLGAGGKSGYPIADVAVYPLRYEPVSGRLLLSETIEITVQTAHALDPVSIAPRPERTERMLRESVCALVDNPEQVPSSASATGPAITDAGTVEYLIITPASLAAAFQPLADWKTQKGVPTEVLTKEYVYSTYPGEHEGDNQDRIRQCVKDYWQNRGLVYVLLGGDVSVIPYRTAFVFYGDDGEAIPSDLYYSDLDGTWDGDGDGVYGEYPSDGIDFYADVYVGRAPVQTANEAAAFVNKLRKYEADPTLGAQPDDFQLRMLMLGSDLDASTHTSVLMDTIEAESIPIGWEISKLYQTLGNLNFPNAMNELICGMNLVAHAGHGATNSIQIAADYLSAGHVYALTNGPRFTGVMYSTACFSGEFPSDDCFGECFARSPNGGGAYIGNSRLGWYFPGYPATGLSAQFQRWFFVALTGAGDLDPLGVAHGVGKDYGVGVARTDATERYCHYELNLFGDPETPVWKAQPGTLQVEHDTQVYCTSCELEVHVYRQGVPQEGACVCLLKAGDIYQVAETDEDGEAEFDIAPLTAGTITVTARVRNCWPSQTTVTVMPTSLSGTVALDQMLGTVEGRTVTIELRTPGTTNVVASYPATLGAAGEYSVTPVLSGTFDLSLKYESWLRETLPSRTLLGPATAHFSLINGDPDRNNEINVADLNLVLLEFCGCGAGDVNCDGQVGVADLNVILLNFGLTGDR